MTTWIRSHESVTAVPYEVDTVAEQPLHAHSLLCRGRGSKMLGCRLMVFAKPTVLAMAW
jgi:hypothetical protein